MANKFYNLMGVAPNGFDREHRFVTSWLLRPSLLAAYRILFALFCWSNLISLWIWDGVNDEAIGPDFSYFTNLTWWGITCYMTVAGLHTVVYAAKGETWLHRWPRPLQALHSLLYTTIITFPFIVTIVYWGILYKNPWFPLTVDAFRNVSVYSLLQDLC